MDQALGTVAALEHGAPLSPAGERSLAVTRNLRRLAFASLFALPVVALSLGVINRTTGGSMRFMVNGAPWTQTFWSALFYVMMAGVLLALLTVMRRCPRCQNGFFVSKGYVKHSGSGQSRGSVNVFARQCLNCQQPLKP